MDLLKETNSILIDLENEFELLVKNIEDEEKKQSRNVKIKEKFIGLNSLGEMIDLHLGKEEENKKIKLNCEELSKQIVVFNDRLNENEEILLKRYFIFIFLKKILQKKRLTPIYQIKV